MSRSYQSFILSFYKGALKTDEGPQDVCPPAGLSGCGFNGAHMHVRAHTHTHTQKLT